MDIDLGKVRTGSFIDSVTNPGFASMYIVLREATSGEIDDVPLSEFPAVLSKYMMGLDKCSTDISLAIGSMSKYLQDKKNS